MLLENSLNQLKFGFFNSALWDLTPLLNFGCINRFDHAIGPNHFMNNFRLAILLILITVSSLVTIDVQRMMMCCDTVTLPHAETDEIMQKQVIALTVHIHIAIIAAHDHTVTCLNTFCSNQSGPQFKQITITKLHIRRDFDGLYIKLWCFVAFFLCYKCMNNLALVAGAKRKCPIMGPSKRAAYSLAVI